MFVSFINKNFILIETELIKSQYCNNYCNYCTEVQSELDKILRIENFKHKRKGINSLSFSSKFDRILFLILMFFIRVNSKFKFNSFKFILDLVHLYLESIRLASNVNQISRINNISESNSQATYQNVDDFIFTPSLKKYFNCFEFKLINLYTILKLFKYSSYTLKFSNSKKTFLFFILFIPIKLLDGMFCKLKDNNSKIIIYTNGSMNLFNRTLSLIAIHNGFKVVLSDHGLVRDCVAEVGIFSNANGYKNQPPPLNEIC